MKPVTRWRDRLQVQFSKWFARERYDYRAEWLRFIATLTDSEGTLDVHRASIRAVAQIVRCTHGVLWGYDEHRNVFAQFAAWPKSPDDRLDRTVGDHAPLPAYLRRTSWLIDLRELAARPALYDGLQLSAADIGAAADALVVPVLHRERLYGWLVLQRPEDLGSLNFEDRDLLKTAGRHIAAHLAQYDADTKLTQAQQFEILNRMTAFMIHDLSSLVSQLRLVTQNAEKFRDNPAFVDDAMRTVAWCSARMSSLVAQLGSGAQAERPQRVALAALAEHVVRQCSDRKPVPHLKVLASPVVSAPNERIANILAHVVRNAQDATPADGDVAVEVDVDAGRPVVRVRDTGCGMDADFIRERLFRAFDSTKGALGMGIGAYQIRETMRLLGGSVDIQSEVGKGTVFVLQFPAAQPSLLATERRAG